MADQWTASNRYSRLYETPNAPQFDLERYVPPRGVPERIQALASPANIERVNEAVRRGVELGGRDFYNTEQLRQAFIGELGPEKGQAAYNKYLNLVGATSPASRVADNIRNAAYHYMRSQQGFPPPVTRWEGGTWKLAEPVPPPWGHIEQALHANKIKEALEQGGLSPLANPKIASFVQNLRGNQTPITIDRHNARLLGVMDTRGHAVDVPPRTGYGFLERLQQQEAAKQGMTPAQYQASGWIGGAEQTGVRSKLTPWLDSLEARIRLTRKSWGLMQKRCSDASFVAIYHCGPLEEHQLLAQRFGLVMKHKSKPFMEYRRAVALCSPASAPVVLRQRIEPV
jgi:hypothetical protein